MLFLSNITSHVPLANGAHRQFNNGKGAGADGHSPHEGRANAAPEAAGASLAPGGGEAAAHGGVSLVGTEAVGLHLALDDVKGVAGEPEELARDTTVGGNLPAGDVLAVDAVALGVGVHHVLKGGEPGAVGGGLTEESDRGAAVDAAKEALVGNELADAVDGPGVQAAGAVGLALQADTDVLDGAGQAGVGDAGKGAGGVVLAVAEGARGLVALLEPAAGGVEAGKLDRDAGADTDERGQGALVEGEGALGLVDGGRGLQGPRVLGCGLEADLDNVKGLACRRGRR